MAFKSIEEITGRSRPNGLNELFFGTDSFLQGKGSGRKTFYALRISLRKDVANKASMQKGDRVTIEFDQEKRLALIKKVDFGGWTLQGSGKPGSERLVFKIQYAKGIPTVANSTGCEVKLGPKGIVFELPEDASFTENLRENRDKKQVKLAVPVDTTKLSLTRIQRY